MTKFVTIMYDVPNTTDVDRVMNLIGTDFVRDSIRYVLRGTVANREMPGLNGVSVYVASGCSPSPAALSNGKV